MKMFVFSAKMSEPLAAVSVSLPVFSMSLVINAFGIPLFPKALSLAVPSVLFATGLRPIAELMFIDFLTVGMDQLVNQAAKMRYMFGGNISVPMVVRLPGGGGVSAAAQHSQSLEAWLTHVPGLKVVYPSTPQDALGLMLSAIDDEDPVMFVEHKAMYGMRQKSMM